MNRREFIKNGAAGAFFISTSSRLFGSAPSERIRFAIVGCHKNGRGFSVMKSALKISGVEIACVCDVDSRALDFCADYLVKAGYPAPRKEKDFRKVLEMADIDGIISETPDHFHAYSAIMAMRAGKAAYVEKPCAFCPAEGELILKTWKETGGILQIGSQRRSQPAYKNAIAEIKAEKLLGDVRWAKTWYMSARGPIGVGKPVAVPEWLDWNLWQGPAPHTEFHDNYVHYNWHWFKRWGTGECGNNFIHFGDIARWMLDEQEYPEEITSSGGQFWIPKNTDWEWPDSQMVTIKYPDGKFITWEGLSCNNQKPYMNNTTGVVVYGTKGEVFFEPWGNSDVIMYDLKNKEVKRWKGEKATGGEIGQDNRTGGGAGDATAQHFANFCDAIRARDQLLCAANGDIGVKSTYLALAANVAQYSCGQVKFDPTTGRPIGNAAADKLWSREYAKGWELA